MEADIKVTSSASDSEQIRKGIIFTALSMLLAELDKHPNKLAMFEFKVKTLED